MADFNKAITMGVQDKQIYFYRGHIKFDQKDFKGSILDYDKAVELGHGEAALWIKPNYDKYFDGLERGFEFEGEVIETQDEDL